MNKRNFKGIWIPANIWLDKKLSPFDKILLLEIDSLDNESGCWKSNKSFAEFMDCGLATVTRSVKKLERFGYIKTTMTKSDYGTVRVIKMIEGVSSKRLDPPNQNDYQGNTVKKNNKDKTIIKDFEIFWADYPRKVGKAKAQTSYEAARKKVSHDDIIRGLFISPRLMGDDPQYIPHAATWLNQESWNDEAEVDPKAFPYPGLVKEGNPAFPGGVLYIDSVKGFCYEATGKKSNKFVFEDGMITLA